MSDLTTDVHLAALAFQGKVSWATVAATVDAQAEAILKGNPLLQQSVGNAVTIIKQGLSNAVSQATADLASHQTQIAATTSLGLETALGAITHGASQPYNEIITGGVDQLVAAAVTAAQAWGLHTKAALATGGVAPALAPA